MKILKNLFQKRQNKDKVPVESVLKELNVQLRGYADALKAASSSVKIKT